MLHQHTIQKAIETSEANHCHSSLQMHGPSHLGMLFSLLAVPQLSRSQQQQQQHCSSHLTRLLPKTNISSVCLKQTKPCIACHSGGCAAANTHASHAIKCWGQHCIVYAVPAMYGSTAYA